MVELLLQLIVQFTHIDRTVDPGLTQIAEQRVIEIQTDWSHDQKPPQTWEVLVWNQGFSDPVTEAMRQWQASPEHWAILTNPSLTRIGCAHALSPDQRDFFACELMTPTFVAGTPTSSIVPAPTQTASPSSTELPSLPDAAMLSDIQPSVCADPILMGNLQLILMIGFVLTAVLLISIWHDKNEKK